MTFLLSLLLVWFLYWIIRGLWRAYRGYRSLRDQFQQFMGDPSGSQGKRQHSRENSSHTPRHREKIIPSDYGEYIEFQELAITGNEHFMLTASINYRLYRHERQTDDAVWEEIRK